MNTTDEMSADGPKEVRRRRRVRWAVTGTVLLGVLGIGTGVVLTRLGAQPVSAAPQAPPPVATAEVVRTDLALRESLTGELGYGSERTMRGHKQGTITELPGPGTVLDRGKAVYQVDATPVVLFLGGLPLYRDVGPALTDGPDVRLVEENLRALGFGGFTVDATFTDATENAIKDWQESLELEATGVIHPADVIVTSGPVRVATVTAEPGDAGSGDLLTYTSTTRLVTVELEESRQNLGKPGTTVAMTVGGKELAGTVAELAPTSADGDDGDGGGGGGNGGDQEKTFTATITVTDAVALGDLDSGSVEVRFTTDTRKGVLVVPVGALLALAEGGYGVEVVDGADRRLLAVETGLFADGNVEVSGDDLSEGMKVVITS
ncbi:peptidoglycan-binding protein [Actinophytocola sp.]|uniref:peptidoglycan-binding protein n=1 Tax=Actinophytocola sp. TaxID=1872138 RepID=UPI002ED0E83C